MHYPDNPYTLDIDATLRLRGLADAADVERIARFNESIHEAGTFARGLMIEHPAARPEHWLLVEDTTTGAVVSSLALLPWTLRYGNVALRSAEMGLVGTDEAYRRRGLVRLLNGRFGDVTREGGYVMSHIQGIGWFYRQFGYDYAMPLEPDWRIEPYAIPTVESDYTFRPATEDDVAALVRWYDEAATRLDISAVRDEAIWRYLLGPSTHTALAAETWIVAASGVARGYVRLNVQGFGEGLIVGEASELPASAIPATLGWLKGIATERGKPYIRFNLDPTSSLVTIARALGAYHVSTYAWQVRVPDLAAFIRAIAPVLEQRVAQSPFAHTTRSFSVDTFREIVRLDWLDGRIVAVASDPTLAWGDLRMLPQLVGPLMLGYRSFDELRHMFPDVGAFGDAAAFAQVLWPPMTSFLYTQY